MPAQKSDLPQGTLDLLILKAVAPAPVHAMRSRNDWNRYRAEWCRFLKVHCILRCTGWRTAAFCLLTGRRPKPDGKPSFTDLHERAGSNWKLKRSAGNG